MLLGPVDISSAEDYDDDRAKDGDTGVSLKNPARVRAQGLSKYPRS